MIRVAIVEDEDSYMKQFQEYLAQYAIRGYAVDALDYVLKPVSYFAFSQRLDRAIARMKSKRTIASTLI